MIDSYAFGKMTVKGRTYKDDLKIISSRVVPDWWRSKGHRFQMEDLRDVLEAEPDVLVLGTGKLGMAKPAQDLADRLHNKGIHLIAQPTAEAVRTFNELLDQGKNVAAGFHLTC